VVDGSSNVADVTLFAGPNQLVFTAGRPQAVVRVLADPDAGDGGQGRGGGGHGVELGLRHRPGPVRRP
jgi:hypothetical protein